MEVQVQTQIYMIHSYTFLLNHNNCTKGSPFKRIRHSLIYNYLNIILCIEKVSSGLLTLHLQESVQGRGSGAVKGLVCLTK